jgi:hypothetical protein
MSGFTAAAGAWSSLLLLNRFWSGDNVLAAACILVSTPAK